MASIKVHGAPYSTAAMRVLCTLYEKDLDYELVHVNMLAGDHNKQPFLSRNVNTTQYNSTILSYILFYRFS